MLPSHREPDASIENDLLKKLLSLPRAAVPGAELADAIRLLAHAMGATTAYLELVTGEDETLWFATGYDVMGNEPPDVVSRGVIARTITDAKVITTSSARADPRFRDLPSVRRERIEAIACAPLQLREVSGALCVQRSLRSGAFSASQLRLVDLFVLQVGQVALRLGDGEPTPVVAPMRDEVRRFQQALVREALVRANGNVARVARELKVARSFVYTLAPWAVRT